MTDSKTVKAANFSAEQMAVITAAAPLNLEKAKAVGAEIGKSFRSVISKAKSMGLEYEVKAVQKKRVGGASKADLVAKLELVTGQKLEGMEKATAKSIANMVAYFDAIEEEAQAKAEAES